MSSKWNFFSGSDVASQIRLSVSDTQILSVEIFDVLSNGSDVEVNQLLLNDFRRNKTIIEASVFCAIIEKVTQVVNFLAYVNDDLSRYIWVDDGSYLENALKCANDSFSGKGR